MVNASVATWTVVGFGAGLLTTKFMSCLINDPGRRQVRRVLLAIITAVVFGAVASRNLTFIELVAYSVFAAVGVQLAGIDTVTRTLPRALIWPTWATVSCLFVVAAVVDESGTCLLWSVAGSAILVSFYMAIALGSRGGVGAGDVRATALVGWMLGWQGLSSVLTGTVLAFLVTSTIAAVLTLLRRKRQHSVPHGPGLLAGALLTLML